MRKNWQLPFPVLLVGGMAVCLGVLWGGFFLCQLQTLCTTDPTLFLTLDTILGLRCVHVGGASGLSLLFKLLWSH